MDNTPSFVKTMHPLLSREDELVLFDQWNDARVRGDRRLENRLFSQIITQYSPIVKKMVKKMRGYGLDPKEMMSEALLALTRAALDFDASKGFRFGTYASSYIKNSLFTFITKNYFMVNVCSNSKNKKVFFNLRRILMEQIRLTGKSDLSIDLATTIAEDMGVEVDTILVMGALLRDPYSSLNQVIGEGTDEGGDNMTKQDLLESTEISQDDYVEQIELATLQHDLVNQALASLDERTSNIVRSQVLTPEGERVTLEELGETFKISKERARQVRDSGLRQMKSFITKALREKNFTPKDILPVD